MFSQLTTAALLAGTALTSPLVPRACANVHVFGARETTAPAGYGSSSTVVNGILSSHPGATSEAINYPACGGQSSCGGASYAQSVQAGISAVVSAVNSYNAQCPDAQLVLVGYSQGGQIFDDAYCGGPDSAEGYNSQGSPLSASAQKAIKAAIFMGDPRNINGLPYNVGTCKAQGFAPRPSGFSCQYAANIKSYCDSADPYCCNGSDANVHQGYGAEYGNQAIAFVNSKLSSGGGSATTTSRASITTTRSGGSTPPPSGNCAALYGQCGGQGFNGPTCCAAGTCKASNQWYSQCL